MRRGRVLILLGLILALATAAAVFFLLQTGTAPTDVEQVQREEVVVAIQPIAENELVDGRLALEPRPVESIPTNAMRTLDGTTGMLAAGPIPQGTILQPDLLMTQQEFVAESQLGQLVEPGFVAVAMPIDELSSVSYGIRPDMHVDVLMTFVFVDIDPDLQVPEPVCPPLCPAAEGQAEATVGEPFPRRTAQLTLQDVRVIGVGRWEEPQTPTEAAAEQQQQQRQGDTAVEPVLPGYITVMVTRQDALVLKLAREIGARIDLAVRAEDDVELVQTQQVTLDYLMARFGVSVPAKQPYTIKAVDELLQPGE
ncbi:MAG: Flp pilus assembly protein CpaB [Anaerolineae bacterium]|nr:Flp pilus assembly protein CpaB [Anaerolineae bacterium]